jgi:hypothetical protein
MNHDSAISVHNAKGKLRHFLIIYYFHYYHKHVLSAKNSDIFYQ